MKTIVCIGDSLVEGEGDEKGLGGWVGRLAQKQPPQGGVGGLQFYNLGIGGDTIRDIHHRLGEALIRQPDICILGCATNDVYRYATPQGIQYKISETHRNRYWPEVLKRLKGICNKVLVTPGLFIETDMLTPEGAGVLQTDFLNHIKMIEEECATHSISFLPIPSNICHSENRSHDVHWNAQGYDALSSLIYDKLTQLGWLA